MAARVQKVSMGRSDKKWKFRLAMLSMSRGYRRSCSRSEIVQRYVQGL